MKSSFKRAVVIGGGTGAPVSIRALLDLGLDVSAVVAMADDGGSTGVLRERAGAIPPGDIRKCLVAMAADRDSPLVAAFRYRFDYANNHALGNLVITALADTTYSFPKAIAICEDILDARGHVYPSTIDRVELLGRTRDGRPIEGQANISKSDTALKRVYLKPADAEAYEPALEALRHADVIVLGPGSLFTSIIPNLLVPGIIRAIQESDALTIFVCGVADMQGETWALNCAEHVESLLEHGMRGLLDYAFIHCDYPVMGQPGSVTRAFAPVMGSDPAPSMNRPRMRGAINRIAVNSELIQRIESQGPKVITRNFVDPIRPTWHDPDVLKATFDEVLS
jgi:uncharacterized cofD-like protein